MIECKTCENYYDFGQKLQCLKGRMEVEFVCNPIVIVMMKECSDFNPIEAKTITEKELEHIESLAIKAEEQALKLDKRTKAYKEAHKHG